MAAGSSIVQICNLSLAEVGAESIISLDDGTVESNQCKLWYEPSRVAVLERHNWNFAMKRASLALDATAPVFDYQNAFALPSDFIRLVGTEKELDYLQPYNPDFNGYKTNSFSAAIGQRDRYKIENSQLLYDDTVCRIVYVFDQQDVTRFSALFTDTLAAYIASRIAYKLTGSRTLVEQLYELFEMRLSMAKLSDSQQGTTERKQSSGFLATRQYL